MTDGIIDADGTLTGAFTEKTYHDAIALVSETVNYLETQGPADRLSLDAQGRAIFAAESMRLSTRLMQTVSWFLVQRAVLHGELTRDQANDPARRLGAVEICLGEGIEGVETLPEGLQHLLERSRSLFEQASRVEAMILQDPASQKSPVHSLLDRLQH